jgi:hypothetical protein
MVHIVYKPKGWPKCSIHDLWMIFFCRLLVVAGFILILRSPSWSPAKWVEVFFLPGPRALKVWSFWSNPRWFADAPGIFWPWHQHHHPPGARTLANACERAGADVSLTHLRNWLPSVDCETPTGSSWIKIDHEMCLTDRTKKKKKRKKLKPPMIWRNLKELDSTSLHGGAFFWDSNRELCKLILPKNKAICFGCRSVLWPTDRPRATKKK